MQGPQPSQANSPRDAGAQLAATGGGLIISEAGRAPGEWMKAALGMRQDACNEL